MVTSTASWKTHHVACRHCFHFCMKLVYHLRHCKQFDALRNILLTLAKGGNTIYSITVSEEGVMLSGVSERMARRGKLLAKAKSSPKNISFQELGTLARRMVCPLNPEEVTMFRDYQTAQRTR